MEQELTSRGKKANNSLEKILNQTQNDNFTTALSKRVAIIGAGPAGCTCAKFLSDGGIDTTVFDRGEFLHTILPTGGGRCNLAHAEYNSKELAKNYPRGEKFLYSIFSKFGTQESLDFFNSIGIKTYTQEDNRIFPTSDSSKDVREKLLNSLTKIKLIKEKVTSINKLDNGYKVSTNKGTYFFDTVVIAIGGHAGYSIITNLNIPIIEPTPALVGLKTKEDLSKLAGVSVKNINIKIEKKIYNGDLLFTHNGISGPLIYTISSIYAKKEMPYNLTLQLIPEINLQEHLDKNPHKEIKNLLGQFIPKSLAQWTLQTLNIYPETPCHKINGKTRDKILNKLTQFEVTITGKVRDGEVVTCGGVDLKEINSKTLESKQHSGLYFCGEVLDIDGFCGGFNLQNCWSTGYITAQSIIETSIN